ncbi:MAG: sensor domain-containing diguanylate cyclase [Acidobacteriota bacterium]
MAIDQSTIVTILFFILGCFIVGILFYILGMKIQMRRRSDEVQRYQDEIRQNDNVFKEVMETVSKLKVENKSLSGIFVFLPEFARQINSNLDRRNIAPLLLKLADHIFNPQQILIFFFDSRTEELSLKAAKGFESKDGKGMVIKLGQGKIGWVAQRQITMDAIDFQSDVRLEKASIQNEHHGFRCDLIAPMIHEGETLGVISLGGLPTHMREQKIIIKMIADLGSIAIYNARLFNSIQIAANHDGLTKLMNRKYFMQRLGFEINKAEKEGTQISIFIFDIDFFKAYNDGNGHLAGDEALKVIGRLLREVVREDDLVARYGGEEFIVALPNTPKMGAIIVAEKIRKMFEDYHFPNQETLPGGKMTISGGLSSFPEDGRSSTDLISHADQALYQAKAKGKNTVVAYEAVYFSDGETEKYYV